LVLENATMRSFTLCTCQQILLPDQIKKQEMADHVEYMDSSRKTCRLFTGRLEGNTLVRRPRRRCMLHIKIYLKEILYEVAEWIKLTQDRGMWQAVVNTKVKL
jgi:hypothetical protein